MRIARYYTCRTGTLEVPQSLMRQLRRADEFIRLGVVAANQVLEGCGLETGQGNRVGLYLGSAFGPMQTNFDVLDQVVEKEPVSPTLFSHSVFNAAAGYIASILGIHGSAITLTDFSFPFFRSLEQGMLAVECGMLDSCLVIQVETYSDLLLDAVRDGATQGRDWEAGAVCWLIERENTGSGGSCLLERMSIMSESCSPDDILSLEEELTMAGTHSVCAGDGVLGAAMKLTEALGVAGEGTRAKVEVASPCGRVEMDLATV